MKRLIAVAVAVLVVVNVAAVAYKMGWLARVGIGVPGTPSAPAGAPVAGGTSSPDAPTSATGGAPSPSSPAQGSEPPASALPPAETTTSDIKASGSGVAAAPIPAPTFAGNVAQLDFGGTVETAVTSYATPLDMVRLLDGDASRAFDSFSDSVKDVVLSFFAREPMLVDAVVFRSDGANKGFPRDVEVLVSSATEPDGRFTKVAAAALPEAVEASVSFAPVEARFVKVRLLNNHSGKQAFRLSELARRRPRRTARRPADSLDGPATLHTAVP
jgi:hypothetical protein